MLILSEAEISSLEEKKKLVLSDVTTKTGKILQENLILSTF